MRPLPWLAASLLALCACGGTQASGRDARSANRSVEPERCMELRLSANDARALGFTDDVPPEVLGPLGDPSYPAVFSTWLEQPGHLEDGVHASLVDVTLSLRGPARGVEMSCRSARALLNERRRELGVAGAEFLATELRRVQQSAAEATAALDAFDARQTTDAGTPGAELEGQRLGRALRSQAVMLQELGERLRQEVAARRGGLDAESACREVICAE